MGKGRNCSLGAISPLIHNILLPDVRFLCLNKDQIFFLRDKRLFEITEVEITRVDCIFVFGALAVTVYISKMALTLFEVQWFVQTLR